MKRIPILIIFALLTCGFFVPWTQNGLSRSYQATEIYGARKSQPMNPEELQAVGMWAAENREIRWEIVRHDDGTYACVVDETYDDVRKETLYKGTWGIRSGVYYYLDLESSDPDADFSLEPVYEVVVLSSFDEFNTKGEGLDGNVLFSNERRVEKFKMNGWKNDRWGANQTGDGNYE